MKKWLKRIAIVFAILLAIGVIFAIWLLQTTSGAQFALARAQAAMDGKLTITQTQGTLSGPLELSGLHFRDPANGVDLKVQRAKIDLSISALIGKTVHLNDVDIDGIDLTLTSIAADPKKPPAPATSIQALLTPPLPIQLDRLHIGKTVVTQDAKAVFAADSLDLVASWTGAGLTLKKLALRAPDGKIDLDATLSSYSNYGGKAQMTFDWRVAPHRIVGTLNLDNDGNAAKFNLALTQPLIANASGTLAANTAALPWTLQLDVPSFDPRVLSGSDALTALALNLKGSGDRASGNLSGALVLNRHQVLLDPLKFSVLQQMLTLQELRLRSPEASGTLSANGKVQLDATPIGGDLDLRWDGVELPADLAGQLLATHGAVSISGNANQFGAHGELAIGPPGKLANIAIKLDGTPEKIDLKQLELKQAHGGLEASGEITLKPVQRWKLIAKANQLDPGAFAKDWPGSLNFTLSTNGEMLEKGPGGTLKLEGLSGTLRQRAISGEGDLQFAPPLDIAGNLRLASGNSTITLRGKSGDKTDATVDLAIASLADWLPQTGGSLRGSIAVNGDWPKLDVSSHIDGDKLAFGSAHIAKLNLKTSAHDLTAPSGELTLDASDVSTAGYHFDTATLSAKGDQAAHHLQLDAHGAALSLAVALDGALKDNNWRGTLATLNLDMKDLPAWKLSPPATIAYVDGALDVGNSCLRSNASAICIALNRHADGTAQAKFGIEHLPLAMIVHLASPDAPLKLDGEINGDGTFVRAVDGGLTGNASLHSDSGNIAYPDNAQQPLIAYRGFKIDAALAPAQSQITVHSDLDNDGRIDGQITIGAHADGADAAAPMSGHLAATINNLGFVDLLTDALASTKGKVDAAFDLSGSTAAPGIKGQLALSDFATEVPAAGLKLHDGTIHVQSSDGETFAIDGSIGSADGKLAIKGSAGTSATSPLSLKITGEDFLAADIPGAQVRISPDLTLMRDDKHMTMTGNVVIPRADVDVSKLPGGGKAAVSPDVVIVSDRDDTVAKPASSMSLDSDITVTLGVGEKREMDLRRGQEVHLVGFGLNGYLSGQLAVQDRPGKATTARGQIQVDGTYKAYGQDLTIEQGRLLFASTPIENPGLDIRATRAFADQDVTVGLQVSGTAELPVLTVFSNKPMEQSDALSYLVAGKPLSQVKGGEGDAVGNAARALGTAGGDLLAKSIGNKMGLDDVGVADNASVGGAALTVGKYLSPRLYLSYGVGLFTPGEVVTLRYKLTRLFDLEIQNGTLSSRAGINYKIEK